MAGRRASEGGGGRRGPPQAARPSLYMYEAAQGSGDGPAAPASGDLHPGATKKGQAKEAGGKGSRQAERARIGNHHARPDARRVSPALNITPGADHGQGRGGTRSGEEHPGRSQRAPWLADSITPGRRGRRHSHRATSRRHGRAGGPGAGTHAQRQVGASEAGQGTPAQRRLASGSGRGKLQRQPTPRTSSGQQYAGRPTPPGPGHPGRGPLSCHRLLPTTRPSVFPSATGPQGAALCHKRNIHLEFVHQSGVRQSGRPRDWPDTRRGFLSGVKVPATQCDRIELPMAAVTRPLLPGCTPTGAPMAKGLRMQTSRVA